MLPATSEIRTVGFVGIGNMGAPMAANLVAKGFTVVAYDADARRAQSFADAHSARAARRLDELGPNVDAVITMLPSGREVRQVFLETEGGLARSLRKGALAIDMSSADPVGTRELGATLAARGFAFIDAPVSGGVVRAKDGTLAIMIGGDAAAVARARPVLSALGHRLFEVGSLGCGHAMKCLNNFLAGTSFAAAAEAVRVGRQFGLDPAVMIDVINVSTGRSFASDSLIKQHVLSESFATGFALGLLAKDVKIAADLAEKIEVEAPLGRMVCDLWGSARDSLGGDRDHTEAARYWDQRGMRRAAE